MMFEKEDFYSQKRGTKVVSFEPREEFKILDCNLLSSTAESAAYCTNCKTPYVRVCPSASTQSDKDKRLYRGVGWTIDTSGEYAAATEEDRDRQYPIAARGYAAFLLSKVVYNKKKNKFSFTTFDDVLEREYFNHILQDVLLPDREDEKLEYRFGYFSRSDCFNETLVELVKQKVEKFEATNTSSVVESANMPKESASQNELQDVRDIFSSDEYFNKFMRRAKLVKTSNGYAKLIYEIDKQIFAQNGIINTYNVLLKLKDKYFPNLGSYDSFRQNYIVNEND